MRSFIGAFLAVGILAGAARADDTGAMKRIEKQGGKFTRDATGAVVGLDFGPGAGITDAGLKDLKDFTQLTTLSL